jgi:hypothetical protein
VCSSLQHGTGLRLLPARPVTVMPFMSSTASGVMEAHMRCVLLRQRAPVTGLPLLLSPPVPAVPPTPTTPPLLCMWLYDLNSSLQLAWLLTAALAGTAAVLASTPPLSVIRDQGPSPAGADVPL